MLWLAEQNHLSGMLHNMILQTEKFSRK